MNATVPFPLAAPSARRPVLATLVLRCLGAGCVEKDLCARHRDLGTPGSRCASNLMDDRGYPCHAFVSTWLSPEEHVTTETL